MEVKKIYEEDLGIAASLLKKDGRVTREFLYKKCYPLFKSIFNNYVTDCDDCMEFISEIYILILCPSVKTGKCQLENYRGESTLQSWLKTICLYYCYDKFEKRKRLPIVNKIQNSDDGDDDSDRFLEVFGSLQTDTTSLERDDMATLVEMMPNKRYQEIIRLRYIEQCSNEETAQKLGMRMEIYYNKHKLAKAQFERIYRKEDYYG